MNRRTLYQMFQESVRRHGSQPAVGFRTDKSPEITTWTYAELDQKVRRFRRGLDALGMRQGDCLAILSENRTEWAIADLAAQSLGIINVAPYASLPAPQVAYIVRDSGSKMLIVSDAKQLKKVKEFRADCPELRYVVAMEGETAALAADDVMRFDAVYARGEAEGRDEAALDALTAAVDPDAPAMFIYTSGTTGDPKGAMLSHTNMLQTPDGVISDKIADIGPGDTFLS